jgi:plasmid stability protein
MKNITLRIDDETHTKARILAAQRGTSVSAMVKAFLEKETSQSDSEAERIAALEALFARSDARAKTSGKKRSTPLKPLTREEIYAERLR